MTTRDTKAGSGLAGTQGETMRAACDVIAARMTIMAEGLVDPLKVDMRELSLMGTEKMEAMNASAAAVAGTLGDLAARVTRSALDEVGHAQTAALAVAEAVSPDAAARAQYDYAVGWWGRAAGQMLTLNSEWLAAQAEALAPIHAAAVANAARLKR